jgi:capsular exopolysaccharide synthesis family protein
MTDSRTLEPLRATPVSESAEAAVSPMLIFSIVRRKKFSILFMGLLMSALAVSAVTSLRPSFMASASVLIRERSSGVTDIPMGQATIATDSVAVRTQADILRSTDLARSVVRKLHLIDMPEFAIGPDTGLMRRAIATVRPFDRAGLIDRLGLDKPIKEPTLEERESFATEVLLGSTSIANDGRSYVIDIKVKIKTENSLQAQRVSALCAEVANAYADAYAQFTSKIKSDAVKQANGFFDDKVSVLRAKMMNAERDVQNYRSISGLVEDRAVSSEGRPVTLVSQQMAQLNADLSVAIAERATAEGKLEQVALALAGKRDLRSVPEIVGAPLIQRLREQQTDLASREAALAMSRGSSNPDLMAIRGSQREVAAQISAETSKIASSLRSTADAARSREATLRGHLAELRTQVGSEGHLEIQLRELQSQAEIAKSIYSRYLKRYEETANQLDVQEPDALVVSRATPPLMPAPPSKKQLGAAGIAVSFGLATVIALVRVRMQSGFRTSEQLEASLGIATLGYIPKLRRPQKAIDRPQRYTAFSEAIFSIRALLRLNFRGGCQVIMVTSALPREGKTFFASSLARNAAQSGQRVLLMDCDLRRPAVAQNITTSPGYDLDESQFQGLSVLRDSSSALDIITPPSGGRSPQDLFASDQMRRLVAELRGHYDVIVLDTPPVLAVSDARILSALSDMTILVVCWQRTPEKLVSTAVALLRGCGARLVGAVMTQVQLKEMTPADGVHVYGYSH